MNIKYLFAVLTVFMASVAVSCQKNSNDNTSGLRVEGISIVPEQTTIKVGDTDTLSYEIVPASAINKNATWNSQNEMIAVIDTGGVVTGIAPGTAMITVESEDGNFMDMAYVTVLEADVRVTGVSLNMSAVRLFQDETIRIEYTIEPINATNTDVTWSSEDESVATVSSEGVITAISIGETIVTATTVDGGFKASVDVLVMEVGKPTFVLDMVSIKAGTFMMGAPESEEYYIEDEVQHEVTLTEDFNMSAYEITTTQFAEFLNALGIDQDGMGEVTYVDNGMEITDTKLLVSDSSLPDVSLGGTWDHGLHWNSSENLWEPAPGCENYPIGHISWYGAVAFADWYGGELPTEAQWEYAYRAGTQTPYPWGDDPNMVEDYGNIYIGGGNMPEMCEIGLKQPNAWGLYDMAGNVREYCYDWYSVYGPEPVTDPTGPDTGEYRVLRGADITSSALYCRSAFRDSYDPDKGTGMGGVFGFRIITYNE